MMNSIFSSFDILSGVEFFGQKTNRIPAGVSNGDNKKSQPEAVKLDNGRSSSPSPSSSVPEKKPQGVESGETRRQRRMGPRFAVEFDGLHCFETILPN
ncbi:hypothetical protein LINGRAHAP2_LOCUS26776 [Linum grandiflorum]